MTIGHAVAELSAELADVHVDSTRVAGEGVTPDTLEKLVAGEHEPLMVEQFPEQVELFRRELDLLASDHDLTPAGVDAQQSVLEKRVLELPRRFGVDRRRTDLTRATSSRGLKGFVR